MYEENKKKRQKQGLGCEAKDTYQIEWNFFWCRIKKKKKSYFLFLNPLQFAGRKWFLFEFLFEKHQSFCGSGTKTMLIWKHGRRIKCGTSWLNLSDSLYTKRKLAERRELASSPWGRLSSSDIKCLQFCIIRKPFCYLLIGFIGNKCHKNCVKGAYTKVMPWMEPICTFL